MTRSVYVTGIDRGDGRQVVELGVMELLTRRVDRVGVFRPLVHEGPDHLFELLRSRYRLAQDPAAGYGMTCHEALAVWAEEGTDELVSRLVDRFHQATRGYEAALVLGTDFAGTQFPDELALNARLADELGAAVLPVAGGRGRSAESVHAEARSAHRAYEGLGCEIPALFVNRVAPEDRDEIRTRLAAHLTVPCYVLPDEPALSAPTVAQITHELGGTVLLGDDAGLARDAQDFVFGGAMLPKLLTALTPGCLVITPGDRADLVVGSLAAHSAGNPPRCTIRPVWPAFAPHGSSVSTCRRSPSSTPPSTRRSRRQRPATRSTCRPLTRTTSAATASTAPRTHTSPGRPHGCWSGSRATPV